ncbi:hypothetical protein [Nitratireductor sp. XY-223]|uniref:hypothetical protein n=1 Tax=Nitratireductor sp. XY-223 TaxID=2561926 RepID=UPI00197DA2B0|nr:hypothetical protein [Nitratireductor sp. XY-223]
MISALRTELATFAVLCLMILALPTMLPLAQALAGEPGQVICTQEGAVEGAGSGMPAGMPGACPCIVSCMAGAACGAFKALQSVTVAFIAEPTGHGWLLADGREANNPPPALGGHGIRAPPSTV